MDPVDDSYLEGSSRYSKILIRHKAQVDLKNNNSTTALHVAVFSGEINIVQLLLENAVTLMSLIMMVIHL